MKMRIVKVLIIFHYVIAVPLIPSISHYILVLFRNVSRYIMLAVHLFMFPLIYKYHVIWFRIWKCKSVILSMPLNKLKNRTRSWERTRKKMIS